MGGKSRYAGAVLALFAAFVLVCGGPAVEGEVYPDSLLPGEVININTADAYDLQRLPGIGEKRAGDIVAYREEHGPFSSVDGLTEVSVIGPGILEGLREYVTAG